MRIEAQVTAKFLMYNPPKMRMSQKEKCIQLQAS